MPKFSYVGVKLNVKLLTDRVTRANLMNSFFHSVFTSRSNNNTGTQRPSLGQQLSDVVLSVCEVLEVLLKLDPSRASGPDDIPGRLLKATAAAISPSLCRLFNMSLLQGVVPAVWKKANLSPIHKGDDPSVPANYRPISLLCILSNVACLTTAGQGQALRHRMCRKQTYSFL